MSEEEIGSGILNFKLILFIKGGTFSWYLGGLDINKTITFIFELSPEIENINKSKFVFI